MPAATETRSTQAQAVAALTSGATYDWDGNAVFDPEETYEDYLDSMPSRADVALFDHPRHYWEPAMPGCDLMPFPRLGPFSSSPSGMWIARNKAQERAIREHLELHTGLDPNELKVSADELAVMNGQKRRSLAIRYCHGSCCAFVSCSPLAISLHEQLTGHNTHDKPKSREG
jgi:hypothetical protein